MRTRLARLLRAAADRLDPPRKVAWGDPLPRTQVEINKALASMEHARQNYGFRASGGRILGGPRSDDSIPAFLSPGGHCDCRTVTGYERILGPKCPVHRG